MAKHASKHPPTQNLALGEIIVDPGIQPRANGLSQEVVADYQAAIEGKDTLPPLVVFHEHGGIKLWLAAGFHRLEAYRLAGAETVECEVHIGTWDDALLYAAGSNRRNGHRMSSEDKRRAIANVLRVHSAWSDREIARHVGCSDKTVAAVRRPERAIEAQKKHPKSPRAEFRTADNRSGRPPLPGCGEEPDSDGAELATAQTELDSIPRPKGPTEASGTGTAEHQDTGKPSEFVRAVQTKGVTAPTTKQEPGAPELSGPPPAQPAKLGNRPKGPDPIERLRQGSREYLALLEAPEAHLLFSCAVSAGAGRTVCKWINAVIKQINRMRPEQ